MRNLLKYVLVLLTAVVVITTLFGCSDKRIGDKTVNKQQPKPAPTLAFEPPTKEEIQEKFAGTIKGLRNNELVVIDDKELWEKMNVQLIYCNYATYAIIGELESIVVINPGWGSDIYDYKVVDLDEDGFYEMIGYYDWGSGIIRSIPFILKRGGEFYSSDDEKIEQRIQNGEAVFAPMIYSNLKIGTDNKSLIADANGTFSGMEYSKVKIYYEDGKYIFELS